MMRFETDPAMSRSAIRRQPIAARISRWSSCLTSRWTHPQLTGSGSSGMGNRIAHGEFDIDLHVAWQTARAELPRLIEKPAASRP